MSPAATNVLSGYANILGGQPPRFSFNASFEINSNPVFDGTEATTFPLKDKGGHESIYERFANMVVQAGQ